MSLVDVHVNAVERKRRLWEVWVSVTTGHYLPISGGNTSVVDGILQHQHQLSSHIWIVLIEPDGFHPRS